MSFLNTLFLWSILAVSIPIIIHLINFRRPQKIAFSTLSFFKKLQQSTIRRLKIKRMLLLALRIAAILLLAIALARPFLPPVSSIAYSSSEAQQIGLLIDNSPSMSAIGEKGPFIEQAKQVARKIIQNAGTEDMFIIQVSNGEAQSGVPVSAERALTLLETIEVVNKGNYLREHLEKLKTNLRQSGGRASIYLLSDGQTSQFGFLDKTAETTNEQAPEKSDIPVQFIKVGSASQRNVAVSGLTNKSQLISTGNPVILEIAISNYSNSTASNQFISMEIGGRMLGQYQTDLEPGESSRFTFDWIPDSPGTAKGKVIIEGDDITFDNTHYFSLKIPESRSVLLVQPEKNARAGPYQSYMKPALIAANETNTQLTFEAISINELDKSDWQPHSAIILDGLQEIPEFLFEDLRAFVQAGKGLMILPSEKSRISNYNAFFKRVNAGSYNNVQGTYASFNSIGRIEQITEGHPVFEDMFEKKRDENIQLKMPELFYYYRYQPGAGSPGITLLKTVSGDEILVEHAFGEGQILISMIGSDPGWSNFPVNPLFAPLFFRSALYVSTSEEGGFLNYTLGAPLEIETADMDNSIEIIKDSSLIKPEITGNQFGTRTIVYAGKEWNPGWAEISNGKQAFYVAVNQPMGESDFTSFTDTELENIAAQQNLITSALDISQLSEQQSLKEVTEAGFGKEIWHWFVIIALILLVTETLLNRTYKTEVT